MMRVFSSRLQWDARPNRLSRLIESKRSAGASIFDLTESNPTRAGLAYPSAIVEAFARSYQYDEDIVLANVPPARVRHLRFG